MTYILSVIITGLAVVGLIVHNHINQKRRDELLLHGHKITATVERIKFLRHGKQRGFHKTGKCILTVYFDWQGRLYSPVTVDNLVKNGSYTVGSKVSIRYLSKYPTFAVLDQSD